MRLTIINAFVISFALTSAAGRAAPPIELEIATEQGVQATAPHEWLQLLAAAGIEHVQIRGIRGGDEPKAENQGSRQQPNYHVVGVLTARDQLRLPGGNFGRGDRAKLKDYFARLAADGAESLTAPRGRFGLTEKELSAALADLTQSIDFETKGQPPRAALDRLQTKLASKLTIDGAAEQTLREAPPLADEMKGVTAGTGLAIVLRTCGLAMRPEKLRGEPVAYQVVAIDADAVGQSTLGKADASDAKCWPIGWELQKAPGVIAPSLMESLNAEIDGYSLDEALTAIGSKLKVPLYVDRASLAAHNIEPTKIQVKLARARMTYKRLLDRVLSQARLGSSLRTDESGKPFVWVTR